MAVQRTIFLVIIVNTFAQTNIFTEELSHRNFPTSRTKIRIKQWYNRSKLKRKRIRKSKKVY